MTFRTLLGTLALLALIAPGVATAQADVPAEISLRWKFTAGQKIAYEMQQETHTRLILPGNTVETRMKQLIDLTWEIKSVEPDGSARLTHTIDRMRMYMDGPGTNRFEFDSKVSSIPSSGMAPVARMIKNVIGVPIELTMSPRGEVTDVKISDKLLDSLKLPGPNGQAVAGMFSEETFKNMASQGMVVFPSEALAAGKAWTASRTVDAPTLGKMRIDTTYTLKGPPEGDAKSPGLQQIDAALEVKLEPSARSPVSVSVEQQNNAGQYLFDTNRGQMTSSSIKQAMKLGLMTGNQQFTQEVESSVTMKLAEPESARK